jgi:hypothetical protein
MHHIRHHTMNVHVCDADRSHYSDGSPGTPKAPASRQPLTLLWPSRGGHALPAHVGTSSGPCGWIILTFGGWLGGGWRGAATRGSCPERERRASERGGSARRVGRPVRASSVETGKFSSFPKPIDLGGAKQAGGYEGPTIVDRPTRHVAAKNTMAISPETYC